MDPLGAGLRPAHRLAQLETRNAGRSGAYTRSARAIHEGLESVRSLLERTAIALPGRETAINDSFARCDDHLSRQFLRSALYARRTSIYLSEYISQLGDKWQLEIDQEAGVALLLGSDISDDLRVPVIEGIAINIGPGPDEQAWLSAAWSEAAEQRAVFGPYRGLDTEFAVGSRYCHLTNDFCPICLERKQQFEIHHCIWKSDGGTRSPLNLLKVCKSCHALMSFGDIEDVEPRDHAAFMHQLAHFGMRFVAEQAPSGARQIERTFLEVRPMMRELVQSYLAADDSDRGRIDSMIQPLASAYYQYNRDIARAVPAFVEFRRLDQEKYEAALAWLRRSLGDSPLKP